MSEVTARIDADGDGLTTGAGDVLGVDLNGDGDALDAGVDSVNVAGLPGSPTRPVIAAYGGTVVTVTYADASPAALRTDTVTAFGEPEPTATPIPVPSSAQWALVSLALAFAFLLWWRFKGGSALGPM